MDVNDVMSGCMMLSCNAIEQTGNIAITCNNDNGCKSHWPCFRWNKNPKYQKTIAAAPFPFGPVLLVLHAPFPSPAHESPKQFSVELIVWDSSHTSTWWIKTNYTVPSELLRIMTLPVWQKSRKRVISSTTQKKWSHLLRGIQGALAHHAVKHLF